MGGHGHGHGDPYTIPDASIYKVEDVPELKQIQEDLARIGLKDPWLRNEVWRYNVKEWGSPGLRMRKCLTRGFGLGLGLTVITVACELAFGGDDHHGHDEGGHH